MSPKDAREKDTVIARKSRTVAVVIAVTVIIWLGAQFIGGKMDLAPKYAILFDLIALAGFAWGLIVTAQLWRARRDNEG